MDAVRAQYEALPYPERDPADERRRLVTGSPSDPAELDHALFRGRRDWRAPFRALVAGGGTGDGLIQLAARCAAAGVPAEITYLDLAEAARRVAEARAAERNLRNIRFLTGDLRAAPELGRFDYIDCCGVLHHLRDPDEGFRALAAALAPDGGIGLMVYAPHGRTGVYPLQEAFRSLLGAGAPAERLRLAKAAVAALPDRHWFRANPFLSDHRVSDAGFWDLLLHAVDRPFAVADLLGALDRAGLALATLLEPARYDPLRYLPPDPAFAARVAALDPAARMALAERLAGDMHVHVAYVVAKGREGTVARPGPEAVPRLNGLPARDLAAHVAKRGEIVIDYGWHRHRVELPRAAAPLLGAVGGGRSLGAIARGAGLDWVAFAALWAPVHAGLTGFNRLHYSRFPA